MSDIVRCACGADMDREVYDALATVPYDPTRCPCGLVVRSELPYGGTLYHRPGCDGDDCNCAEALFISEAVLALLACNPPPAEGLPYFRATRIVPPNIVLGYN